MNMKAFLFILLLVFPTQVYLQDVYQLSKGVDIPLFSSGSIGIGISIPIGRQIKPLETFQLEEYDTLSNYMNKFDRIATTTYGIQAQKHSDIFLYASPALPIGLLADRPVRNEYGDISLMYLETTLVNFGLTELIKVLVRRTRPYVYNTDISRDYKLGRDARKSFFSGHTSQVAATSFFTAKILADNHAGDDLVPLYWASAAIIPAITGYLRVKGGKHFPTDVIAGYLVGALVGIFIPELHKL